MTEPIWRPTADRIANSNLTAYLEFLSTEYHLHFADYHELYKWSVLDVRKFWESIRVYSRAICHSPHDRINDGSQMWDNHWYPGLTMNYAENLLRHKDDKTAIVHWNESGQKGSISFAELNRKVADCAAALQSAGVGIGDRVAAYITNIPEAVIMMLATTSLGAIWSSCSPDFGLQGVLDRFLQIEPKVLLAVDSYCYHGKEIDRSDVLSELIGQLPMLERVVVVSRKTIAHPKVVDWSDFAKPTSAELRFVPLGFDHPIYILYSSGTTGAPKCIVHGAGGTLLQHFKEHALHTDLKPGDLLSYFTTCGWMMWNWLVGALFDGVAIFLYDGSPAQPDLNVLWNAIDEEEITAFGTSPKFLQACEAAGLRPAKSHRLDSLRVILSTGSPLPDSSFDWVYDSVKSDVQLASISGGTDIVSCFMLGCPTIPVYRGEIQTRGLGMRVQAFNDSGRVVDNQVGELVCTAPFPSRPVKFWNDPDGSKYRSAYFEHFKGVWRHGDYIKITSSGGVIVYGRSDATLNRGGVRIGTAEIYGPVEKFAEVEDSLVVERKFGDESEILLFIVVAGGRELTEDLVQRLRLAIRKQESPRHVPDRFIAIKEVPRTVSGKKVELAVAHIINGRPVSNREALANPHSLDQFEEIAAKLSSGSES